MITVDKNGLADLAACGLRCLCGHVVGWHRLERKPMVFIPPALQEWVPEDAIDSNRQKVQAGRCAFEGCSCTFAATPGGSLEEYWKSVHERKSHGKS